MLGACKITTQSVLSSYPICWWGHRDSWMFFAVAAASRHIYLLASNSVYLICRSYTPAPPPSCTVCDARSSLARLGPVHSYDSVWCLSLVKPRKKSISLWFFDSQFSNATACVQHLWSYPRYRVDTTSPNTRAYHRTRTFPCIWGTWIIALVACFEQTCSALIHGMGLRDRSDTTVCVASITLCTSSSEVIHIVRIVLVFGRHWCRLSRWSDRQPVAWCTAVGWVLAGCPGVGVGIVHPRLSRLLVEIAQRFVLPFKGGGLRRHRGGTDHCILIW